MLKDFSMKAGHAAIQQNSRHVYFYNFNSGGLGIALTGSRRKTSRNCIHKNICTLGMLRHEQNSGGIHLRTFAAYLRTHRSFSDGESQRCFVVPSMPSVQAVLHNIQFWLNTVKPVRALPNSACFKENKYTYLPCSGVQCHPCLTFIIISSAFIFMIYTFGRGFAWAFLFIKNVCLIKIYNKTGCAQALTAAYGDEQSVIQYQN